MTSRRAESIVSAASTASHCAPTAPVAPAAPRVRWAAALAVAYLAVAG
ncbi:hypothetical protein BURMUCF2_A0345, partial [Burkholderia multivorans CF2]